MGTMTRDDYDAVVAGLGVEYIDRLASEIVEAVGLRGRPLVTAYEPGDMTRYVLAFTPLDLSPVTELAHVRRGYRSLGEDTESVVEDARGVETGLGVGAELNGRYALVSYVDHGAYPFELFLTVGGRVQRSGAKFDPGYVGDKLGVKPGPSAIAVACLLNATSGSEWWCSE